VVIAVPDQFGALGVQYPVQSAIAVVLQRVAVDRGDLSGRIGGDGLCPVLQETVAADQVLVADAIQRRSVAVVVIAIAVTVGDGFTDQLIQGVIGVVGDAVRDLKSTCILEETPSQLRQEL